MQEEQLETLEMLYSVIHSALQRTHNPRPQEPDPESFEKLRYIDTLLPARQVVVATRSEEL